MTFFPLLPSGNFFNNWMSLIIYYPLSFLIFLINSKSFMLKIIFLLILIINLPIIIFFRRITKLIGIYDKVDNFRKFHKKDIALFGGILIFINLSFFIVFDLLLNLNLLNENISNREYFSFYFDSSFFFFRTL